MDGWAFPKLERDLGRFAALILVTATAVGAGAGWLASQVFVHLHTHGVSDHPWKLHR